MAKAAKLWTGVTPKMESFCRKVAQQLLSDEGVNLTRAYLESDYQWNGKAENARQRASDLRRRDDVKERVRQIIEQATAAAGISEAMIIASFATIASDTEASTPDRLSLENLAKIQGLYQADRPQPN